MDEKYVVSLRNVAIYHADSVFGRGSEEKLMRQGEMVLSEVNLNVAPGEFVYLIGRVGSGKSSLLKTLYAEVPLLTGEGRIAGFDLVEVVPCPEDKIDAVVGARVLYKLCGLALRTSSAGRG